MIGDRAVNVPDFARVLDWEWQTADFMLGFYVARLIKLIPTPL